MEGDFGQSERSDSKFVHAPFGSFLVIHRYNPEPGLVHSTKQEPVVRNQRVVRLLLVITSHVTYLHTSQRSFYDIRLSRLRGFHRAEIC